MRKAGLTTRSVRWFFSLTFLVSWGMGILFVSFPEAIEGLFGPMGYTNPAFILLVYGPGIVGIAMVWRAYGTHGLKNFCRRLTLWRMPAAWWLLVVVGIPASYYLAAAVEGGIDDAFPFHAWYGFFPALLPALFVGPIEEFGWRGVALPLLQRRFAPLWAALIVGGVSALWHTPAFFMSGTKQTQNGWAILPFMLGVVAISVILTPMFNAAKGSLLVAFVFHAQLNGPAWPDSTTWYAWVFSGIAAIVVIANRKTMLKRGTGATNILMPDEEIPGDTLSPGLTPPDASEDVIRDDKRAFLPLSNEEDRVR